MSKHRMRFDPEVIVDLPTALSAAHLTIEALRQFTETRGHRVEWSSLKVEFARHIDGDIYVTAESGAVPDPDAAVRHYVIASPGSDVAFDGDDPFLALDDAMSARQGYELVLERIVTPWREVSA